MSRIILLLVTISFLLPAHGFACGQCVDKGIMIRFPFTCALMLLCFMWFVAGRILKNNMGQHAQDTSKYVPGRYVILGFGIGSLVLSFFTMGSILTPGLVIGVIWVLYILIKVISGLIRWRGEKIAKAFFFLHVAFLFLAAATIPYGYNFSLYRSTYGLISLLDDLRSETSSIILPALIAKGDSAVDPLIAATQKALVSSDEFSKETFVSSAAFCLGRIGGPKAEAFLGKLVRTKVDFKEDDDWLWEKVVCFAYAECAKERAVSNLVELYDRCNGKNPEMQRWTVIAALAKTQSRRGVIFALDHMDVLIESAKAGYAKEDLMGAGLTASALLFKSDPAVLGKIPLYRYSYGMQYMAYRLLPESLTGDLGTEFYWTESDGKLPGAEEFTKVWEETGEKVRKRWLAVLK